VKEENGDLLANSHSILNREKNYFSQLLNVHRGSDIRQIDTHIAKPLVPNPSPFDVENAIGKLKIYKSPSTDQIPAELIQVGGEILRSEIHKLINSIRTKENCLISERSLLLYQFTRRAIQLTVVIVVGYHCYQLYTKFYPISYSQGQVQMKLLGIISVGFDVTDQRLIRSFAFVRYLRKNENTVTQYISYS
jgi:hypothetical protein